MPFKKKAILLSFIFIAIGAIAVILTVKDKPSTKNKNPFFGVDANDIGKIIIDNYDGHAEFVNEEDGWILTQPFRDWTDKRELRGLIDSIIDLDIASIVSEQKDSYKDFQLDDKRAKHLQVFFKGDSEPALNGYFGKHTPDIAAMFFRFADQDPVYLSYDFENLHLNRKPLDFRLRQVVLLDRNTAKKASFKFAKGFPKISQSSATWINDATGKKVGGSWIRLTFEFLREFRILEFIDGVDKTEKKYGLNAPRLTVALESEDKSYSFKIGNKGKGPTQEGYYCSIENREALFIIRSTDVDDFLSHLPNFE